MTGLWKTTFFNTFTYETGEDGYFIEKNLSWPAWVCTKGKSALNIHTFLQDSSCVPNCE